MRRSCAVKSSWKLRRSNCTGLYLSTHNIETGGLCLSFAGKQKFGPSRIPLQQCEKQLDVGIPGVALCDLSSVFTSFLLLLFFLLASYTQFSGSWFLQWRYDSAAKNSWFLSCLNCASSGNSSIYVCTLYGNRRWSLGEIWNMVWDIRKSRSASWS